MRSVLILEKQMKVNMTNADKILSIKKSIKETVQGYSSSKAEGMK